MDWDMPLGYEAVRLLSTIKGQRDFLRVGQIVSIAAKKAGYDGDIFYIEDEELIKGLKIIYKDMYGNDQRMSL